MKKIVVLSTLIVFAVSCATQLAEPETDSGAVVIEACTESARTSISGLNVIWSRGDELSMLSESANSRFTLSADAGTTSAKFSGDIQGTTPSVALFPYRSSASLSAGVLSFPVPQTQTYAFGSFGPGAFPMVAAVNSLDSPIRFRNLFGVLQLSFTGAATISRLTVRDLDGAMLWGKASLDLNADGAAPVFSGGSDTVVLDFGAPLTLAGASETTLVDVALPENTLAHGFEVCVYNGDVLLDKLATTTSSACIVRSGISPMKSRMIPLDLSAGESANCYMVYSDALYMFKAVKGNSSIPVSDVASADALWESLGTDKAPAAGTLLTGVEYKDGYIYFNTTGVPGNALIAARDASGNILWSWHVWIPSTRVTDVRFSSMSSGSIQDRNLGALTADKGNATHNGLIYQWGRKDPFMGFCAHSSGQTLALASACFTSKTVVPNEASSAATGTVEYATAHPATFITNTASGNRDWCNPENNDHWGASKTMYDPCPPGYRVPDMSRIFTSSLCASATKDAGGQGYVMEGVWFPFSGVYWQDASRHGSTNTCSVWSCVAGSQGGRMLIDDTASNKVRTTTVCRSYGCSVRCVTAADPTPAGTDEHDFFAALPEEAEVVSLSDGSLDFSNGSSFLFDSSVCGLVRVSEDGFWEINGNKTSYRHASVDFMEIGPNNRWMLNGSDTGERAVARNMSAGPNDIYVANIVESARRITLNFNNGSYLVYPKKISWGLKVEKTANLMYVYMGHSNSDNWIRYKFSHRTKNVDSPDTYPNHLDNWGLGQPARCTRSGSSFVVPARPELFLNGESEAAVQLADVRGNSTYTGGTLHGWENILDSGSGREIFFWIDGVPVGETDVIALKEASRVDVEQHTRIARAYGDPAADQYATIVKKWSFQDGRPTIYVEYTFTDDVYLNQSKFGMMCVMRRDESDNSVYMSRLVRKNNDPHNMYNVEDGWNVKADPGYDARSYSAIVSNDRETTRVEEYGDAGFSFAMELDESSPRTSGGFNVGTNGNNYNKIYFDIAYKQNVTASQKIHSTIHWEIDYISDYKLF